MKCLLIAIATLAVAQAAVLSSQYHSQDGHHGYNYGYSNKDSEKEETASHDRVRGEYKFSDKHGVFSSEVKYDVPNRHHEQHHHQQHHGFGHHHEQAKPFSYSTVAHHPEQRHHQHKDHTLFHYERQNFHHLHKRSLWHHNDHQQQLSHNELVHHEPIHHEEHKHWTGPIHIPVIKNGVPTESPEILAARNHHAQKVAEAYQHSSHSGHNHGWENNHHHQEHHQEHHHEHHNEHHHQHHHEQHHEHHHDHHHEQPKWTGPIHVPVIEHGVPTETPAVKHAKALFHAKHSEAKVHSALSSNHHDHSDHGSYYGAAHGHEESHHNRWTGPIHVPVIEHGVPTETPEIRAAKAHHAAKHSEAHHSGSYHHNNHHDNHHDNHYAQQYNYHDEHQHRWTGPTHKPVIVHGVPTETPEVLHAKAHHAAKHAEAGKHAGHQEWDQGHQYAQHYHHADHQKWTGPIHVPVIEHGVPTETPEVRHAKAHILNKHYEAQSHPDFHKDDHTHHGYTYEKPHHSFHEESRWTGPIHVPVLHNGVPTETPEVRHAKEHLNHAHAQAKSHEVGWHKAHKHY